MSSSFFPRMITFGLIILLIGLCLTGCKTLQATDDDSQFASQEQALESEDEFSEGIDLSGDEDPDNTDPMNPDEDYVALACPAEATNGWLSVKHFWNWAPNRNQDQASIDGWTGEWDQNFLCELTVVKDRVYMDQCSVPIENEGYMMTSNGAQCDISAVGRAWVSIEDAYCEEGVIYMTIIEYLDTEHSLDGEKTCPGFVEPWSAIFPTSVTNVAFRIQGPGDYTVDIALRGWEKHTEEVDPDYTGQFNYVKEWDLELDYLMLEE